MLAGSHPALEADPNWDRCSGGISPAPSLGSPGGPRRASFVHQHPLERSERPRDSGWSGLFSLFSGLGRPLSLSGLPGPSALRRSQPRPRGGAVRPSAALSGSQLAQSPSEALSGHSRACARPPPPLGHSGARRPPGPNTRRPRRVQPTGHSVNLSSPHRSWRRPALGLAPRVGLEPTTLRLTAACSTIELPRNRISRFWAQNCVCTLRRRPGGLERKRNIGP